VLGRGQQIVFLQAIVVPEKNFGINKNQFLDTHLTLKARVRLPVNTTTAHHLEVLR
jgi:hypothetical protein